MKFSKARKATDFKLLNNGAKLGQVASKNAITKN